MSSATKLEQLCTLCGINLEYHDVWGQRRHVSSGTQHALLAAMGVAVDTEHEVQRSFQKMDTRAWRRPLPPVMVIRRNNDTVEIPLSLPASVARHRFEWVLALEDGSRRSGELYPAELDVEAETRVGGASFRRCRFSLPQIPDFGYHVFELRDKEGSGLAAHMSLIVAPPHCYYPEALSAQGRVWGLAVQLYALRSQRNWGMGDFTDLKALIDITARAGAGIVGVNPFHTLFPHNPAHASPYSPSSRLFLNVLYLDVEAVDDYVECEAARDIVHDSEFQAKLRALRAAELVEYGEIATAKLKVLQLLYLNFRERHLAADGQRAKAFRAFQAEGGKALRQQALFEALQQHFFDNDASIWGWPAWPEPYRDPDAQVVARFAAERPEQVEFFEYLQWQSELQLAAIGRSSWEHGLGVGLYLDLALGVDRGGGEVWATQDLYALGASIGAPPDVYNLNGQDWGLPPMIPQHLADAAYVPFIATLRANMRHAGAVRIDHVMGLKRLFWIPAGGTPATGAYVDYPVDDLFGIVALESHRNHCLVIGEDLGTVPDAVREAMARYGVLSYRLFYFEKEENGCFKLPAAYPGQALVTISTHDLPTLGGFWRGTDLDARAALGLFPSDEMRQQQIVSRAQDRAQLLVALEREHLLPESASVHPVGNPEMTAEVSRAIHVYLARSSSKVMMARPEDILDQIEQVNLPGSTYEYPNWRRKLPLNIGEWEGDPRFAAIVEALRAERGSSVTPRERPAPVQGLGAPFRVPLATYRVQFNSGFTFAQAAELVPYLHELGISHCYCSPYLKARPGSIHGYDIIDHNALNPEVGGHDDFERFAAALRDHGMGQIIDVVPNHMGVQGSDNAWWLDVLENGQSSVYAGYFDIDWEPLNEELRGKVLLPVLGDHYGSVLNNGELKLCFDGERGEFSIHYFSHRFPIDPHEYPRIIGHQPEKIVSRLGNDNPQLLEFQSLVTAFGHLPLRSQSVPEKMAERNRDKELHKRHLAGLCRRSPDISQFIAENAEEFNGRAGDPASFDLLHQLIKAQAFRLAYWRVASDEINYRRFFDINDLAALRMENAAVFEATHRLIFELAASGKADGLRIDHPDGLNDPGQYFQRLQDWFVTQSPADRTDQDGGRSAGKSIYLIIEKILAEFERLPESWRVHGSTGYRFLNVVNGLFVDTEAEAKLERIYAKFIGERIDFGELLYRCKRVIMRASLASELTVLANHLSRIAQASRTTCDFTLNNLRDALLEIVACFPVYRSYITAGGVSVEDRRYIDWAVAVAKGKSRAADVTIFDFVRDVLTTDIAEGRPSGYRDMVIAFAMKFQQFTAPVMAKGMEDTSFYIYNRLVSLNDVGGDPRTFGFTLAAFHGASQDRAANWPHTMITTSTHDTKRSEDVRARINVLSEMPAAWKLSLTRWSRMNRSRKREVDAQPAPSRNDEYLLYQTLIGTWPLAMPDQAGLDAYRERIERYMLKVVREAKVSSSWINPNAAYEDALLHFVRGLLGSFERNPFLADFVPQARMISRYGMLNSLSQILIKLCSPGVPDIYQGNELWEFNLVDPDNRRQVDYPRRQKILEELKVLLSVPTEQIASRVRGLLNIMEDGRAKLYTTWQALQLRQRHPELFQAGDYMPLLADGDRARHIVAFARHKEAVGAIVIAPRFFAALVGDVEKLPPPSAVWGDTAIGLAWLGPGTRIYNVMDGRTLIVEEGENGGRLPIGVLTADFPVALLEYELPQ